VGLWRRDQEPNGSEDVVITMVQSIMGRDYDGSCYEGFGTIITDEVHRFSAPLWSNAIGRFDARYRVGLTATPDRSDGLERVFMSHIGSIEHEVRGNLLSADIYPIEFNYTYPMKDYILWDGQVSISKLITVLAKDDMRSEVIIDYAVRSLMTGRKVLILCDRRQHVTYLAFKCSERLESLRALREDMPKDLRVAAYLGGMKASEREDAEGADLIIGTYSMAQEGLDIPRLDTLFLASPKTNVTQAIGRILRPHPDKKKPVVLDFIDNVGMLKGFARKRKKQYAQNGYALKRALSDVASP
jgi:superfamily II DNA or RNA helicase